MNFKLVFEKTLEKLGLDPGSYRLSFVGADQIKDLTAASNNPWGLACNGRKIIWVKNSLSEMEKVRVLLHELRHLQQFKLGYNYPADLIFMESDAKKFATANLMDSYLLAKYERVLSKKEFILAGFDLIRTL